MAIDVSNAGSNAAGLAAALLALPLFDKARVYLNSATNTTNAGWQKIPIDTVDFDTNSIWVASTSKRFTPKKAGYYHVNGRVAVGTAMNMGAGIAKNGSQTYGLGIYSPPSTITSCGGGALIFCNGSTDYLELWVYTTAAAAAITTGTFDTFMDIVGPF
jgi:hypothetical protein